MTLTMPGATPLPKRKTRARRRRVTFDTTLGRSVLQALAVIVFFALWEMGVRAGWISAFLVGSPFGIFATGYKMLVSGDLLSDTWYTLFEAILGFIIGTIIGSLLGLALWYSVFVARLVEPLHNRLATSVPGFSRTGGIAFDELAERTLKVTV